MRKILIGCGVAAGLVCVLLVIVGLGVRSWVRKEFPNSGRTETIHAQLEERFGKPEAYVPPLDGALDASRVERFVVLREALVAKRDGAAARLSSFIRHVSDKRDADRPWITKAVETAGTVRGGGQMALAMADYFSSRGQLLLDAEMGEGEYRYLYGLAYFDWLGWQPVADSTAASELRRLDAELADEIESARSRTGRLMRVQFENQQRALEAKPSRTAAEDRALAALRAELPESSRTGAFPFIGGAPAEWTAAFEPYRARLQATLPRKPLEAALDVMRFESRGKRGVSIH